jgi:hypothetical protein
MNKQNFIFATLVALSLVTASKIQAAPTAAETRAISKEAFTWGFPAVDSYKTLYSQAVDKSGKDFKAPFNKIGNTAGVFTADDKAIITPNSDTPYSFLWADLRAEPLVLTVPKIEEGRYYSLQFIDLFTQNFAYAGTRTKGNGGGKYLLAGPNWKGEKPAGIDDVFRSETEISYVLYRTQLFGPDDLSKVKAIQQGYKVEGLNAYLGKPAPKAAPAIKWPKPDPKMEEQAVAFHYLNFLLQFAPAVPSEVALRKKFETIGVVPGKPFDQGKLSADQKTALQAGIDDAWKEFAEFKKTKIDTRQITSGDMFGTREFLKGNYLYRFSGAKLGIYGNSREEALYPAYFVDAEGKSLNAATTNYVLNFTKENMPPAISFWSVTMYDGKSQFLVANPLKRYLVNSPMLPQFKKDADGKFTIYIQKDSPGADKESNWLPAPDGPFYLILRLYQPRPSAFDGSWHRPELLPSKR